MKIYFFHVFFYKKITEVDLYKVPYPNIYPKQDSLQKNALTIYFKIYQIIQIYLGQINN